MAVDLFAQMKALREKPPEPVQEAALPVAVTPVAGVAKGFKFGSSKPAPNAMQPSAPVVSPPLSTGVPVQTQSAVATLVQSHKQVSTAALLDIDIDTFNKGSAKYTGDAMAQINGALQMLKDSITDSKLVGQAVRNIMLSLQEAPELKDMLAPEDIGLMVQGLRNSYGVVLTKKSETKSARSAKKVDQQIVDDAFADLEF